jgi:hypothetical protein
MLTATAPRFLTIVELVSRALTWDDCQNCPVRDRKTVEIVSDRLLSTVELNAYTNRYPAYVVIGVHELDNHTAPDEF